MTVLPDSTHGLSRSGSSVIAGASECSPDNHVGLGGYALYPFCDSAPLDEPLDNPPFSFWSLLGENGCGHVLQTWEGFPNLTHHSPNAPNAPFPLPLGISRKAVVSPRRASAAAPVAAVVFVGRFGRIRYTAPVSSAHSVSSDSM